MSTTGAAGDDRRFDTDWLVIGSGFGGSVSALRLSEKGHRVLVLERGERFEDADMPSSSWDLRRYFYAPRLGMRGIFKMTFFRDVTIMSGAGVGGGSLTYAMTLYVPPRAFFEDRQWAELADWQDELAPHYETAQRMLGVTDVTVDDPADQLLKRYADTRGVSVVGDMPIFVALDSADVWANRELFQLDDVPLLGLHADGHRSAVRHVHRDVVLGTGAHDDAGGQRGPPRGELDLGDRPLDVVLAVHDHPERCEHGLDRRRRDHPVGARVVPEVRRHAVCRCELAQGVARGRVVKATGLRCSTHDRASSGRRTARPFRQTACEPRRRRERGQ